MFYQDFMYRALFGAASYVAFFAASCAAADILASVLDISKTDLEAHAAVHSMFCGGCTASREKRMSKTEGSLNVVKVMAGLRHGRERSTSLVRQE